MPYADPERQKQYYRDRQERRKTDKQYIERRKKLFKERYDNDPEFKERYLSYQSEYKKKRRKVDPEFRAKEQKQSIRSGRLYRGVRWTPEEEAQFNALVGCEVCGKMPSRGLAMDHCHDCHRYRGGLCSTCNHQEGVLRKWKAVPPEDSPMYKYLKRHKCIKLLRRRR